MVKTFICPDCGKEVQQVKSGNRQFCAKCAKERRRKDSKALNAMIKESYAIKAKSLKKDPVEVQKQKERKALDAEMEEKRKKQLAQCKKCRFRLQSPTNGWRDTIGCDFVSKKRHSRDKGEGPGKCGSFEPLVKESRKERTQRLNMALAISEANNAQNTGEKMREVN